MVVRSCFAFLPARPGRIRGSDCSIIAIRPNDWTEIIANLLPAWRGGADNGWGLWWEDHDLSSESVTGVPSSFADNVSN